MATEEAAGMAAEAAEGTEVCGGAVEEEEEPSGAEQSSAFAVSTCETQVRL